MAMGRVRKAIEARGKKAKESKATMFESKSKFKHTRATTGKAIEWQWDA